MRTLTKSLCLLGFLTALPVFGGSALPKDVPNFVPPKPGEHPRLLFRQSDLPALKARAETPEGKAILARLRLALGNNGESLPEKTSPATKGYPGPGKYLNLEVNEMGYLTLGHPAGYGLLYQLTGEKKYAELGKQAFEVLMKGVRDVDSRYSLVGPNGELRSGSSWGIAGLGYDLCYDGWDEAFRLKVVKTLLSVQGENGGFNLKKVATKPKYGPSKNHFGGIICGALGAAAIMGDPGTETEKIFETWMPAAYQQTTRMLTGGFGDHGFYSEGHGPSHVSSDTGMLPWLQAAKIACGKDFITEAPGAWLTMRWVMELVPLKGGCQYPDRQSSAGGSYGDEHFWRGNYWSHGGQFAQGFGAVDTKYVPAMLWVYRNFLEPFEMEGVWCKHDQKLLAEGWVKNGEKTFDSIRSPWKAVMAFVSWPIGVEPINPVEVLGHSMEDRTYGYYVFRNQWKDENDILLTALLGYGPKDAYKPQSGPLYLWAYGKKQSFGSFKSAAPATYEPSAKGAVVFTPTQCLGVDFSRSSGTDALFALVGIDAPKSDGNVVTSNVTLSGKPITIVTLQSNAAPEVKAEGEQINVGGQSIRWDGKKIVFTK